MKKGLTMILALILSVAAFAQTSVEVAVGRGAYGETYKQLGINYKPGATYTYKAAFGLDRIDGSHTKGVRQTIQAGVGIPATKQVEVFTDFAVAFDRINQDNLRTQYGATFGANYHFKGFSLGAQYNTIPVYNTPEGHNRSPFPSFILGVNL